MSIMSFLFRILSFKQHPHPVAIAGLPLWEWNWNTVERGEYRLAAVPVGFVISDTGLKSNELFLLTKAHVDISDPYKPELWIKHTGKQTKKDRKVALPARFTAVYTQYIEKYAVEDKLFPFTDRFMRMIFGDLKRKIEFSLPIASFNNTEKSVSCVSFRLMGRGALWAFLCTLYRFWRYVSQTFFHTAYCRANYCRVLIFGLYNPYKVFTAGYSELS